MAKNTEFDTEAYSDLVAEKITSLGEPLLDYIIGSEDQDWRLFTARQFARLFSFSESDFSEWLAKVHNGPMVVLITPKPGGKSWPYYRIENIVAWAEARQEARK